MDREPAGIIGAVVLAVEAIIVAIVALGVLSLDEGQIIAVMGAVAAVGVVVQAVWTRSRVYSPASMEKALT